MTNVRLNQPAIAALDESAGITAALLHIGEQVAERAAQSAPKRTGAGAASIHAEFVEGYGGTPTVRVGWDRDHFYLGFFELGTSKISARPFLRPALDAQYEV